MKVEGHTFQTRLHCGESAKWSAQESGVVPLQALNTSKTREQGVRARHAGKNVLDRDQGHLRQTTICGVPEH